MATKSWMTGIKKWVTSPDGRRDAIVSTSLFAVAFFLISRLLNRDLSYLWMVGATGFTVAVLAWATLRIASRRTGYSFSHSLLMIFIMMVPLAIYRWSFIAFGRPSWMFDGLVFDLFIGSSGGVLGAMMQYLRTVGHMQQESKKYKILFWLIIVATFLAAILAYKE